ncbi:UNVERIFIED_CONTAM: hypothetical protein GTU68_008586 [Idotea baltica]|nr:hypothetical protein [Idotea baltica]
MSFVDTVMAGRVSSNDLASVALGNSMWVPMLLLMTGTLLSTTAKVAQFFGENKTKEIGALVRQALWLALFIGCTAAFLLWNAEALLHWMNVEESLIPEAMIYLHAVALGFPAFALYHVLRCFSEGLGLTRPSMVLSIIGLILNIPLNYIFIYGKLGLPRMGGAGCGVATAIVMILMFLGMLIWIKKKHSYQFSDLFKYFDWPQWKTIKNLLFIGLPIGIAVFAETSIFAIIALLIGKLGATVISGHQIALNFSSLVFMVPYSISIASTIRVGQLLGQENATAAYFASRVSISTALTYACCAAFIILLFRHSIASLYSSDTQVINLAASLIIYSAIFQLPDAVQATASGALRGYQDTRVTMIITLFSYWCAGLPIGYVLGMTHLIHNPSGPHGLWQGLVIGLSCSALLLILRLKKIARRRINQDLAASTAY